MLLTGFVGLRDLAAHHRQTICQSPLLKQSLGKPAVSDCVLVPQSPMCNWHSLGIRKGIQGFLSSHLDYIVCNCNFELKRKDKETSERGFPNIGTKHLMPTKTGIPQVLLQR